MPSDRVIHNEKEMYNITEVSAPNTKESLMIFADILNEMKACNPSFQLSVKANELKCLMNAFPRKPTRNNPELAKH